MLKLESELSVKHLIQMSVSNEAGENVLRHDALTLFDLGEVDSEALPPQRTL